MEHVFCKLITLAVIIIAVALTWHYFYASRPAGTIIILNGPSAAGKSSIQKEFQSQMMLQPSPKGGYDGQAGLWIKLGIDNLFDKPMPDINMDNLAFWQSPNPIRWVTATQDQNENPIITLFTGEQGDKVAYGMNSAIAAYAQNGCNIIVDYIAYKKEWLDDLRSKLKDYKLYWVKVAIPLEILEQREIARATSPKGHARSHYDFVHWDISYDLEVDSGKDSALKIAQQIKEFISKSSR